MTECQQIISTNCLLQAYKNFGTRVNNLRKKLIEYAKTVPDPVTASPILSPSMDAPSPGNTPSEDEMDNRETVDMDLSDEEAGAATAHGTGKLLLFMVVPQPRLTLCRLTKADVFLVESCQAHWIVR